MRHPRLLAGTSGFSYAEWKGIFYPEDLPAAQMLGYYATKLAAVEINNTFYRMPKPELLERWAAEVPEGFRFAIKAPQRITHKQRLADAGESVGWLWEAVQRLGVRRGPILFQLPPFLRKDVPLLAAFLGELPPDARAAFEFRHASWDDEEVRACLARAGASLVVADVDDAPPPEVHATAAFGYLRLRRVAYSEDELRAWAERVRGARWDEAFVFFKHEDAGTGPRLAAQFTALYESLGR